MTKAEQLVDMLREGWKTTEDIHLRFSWQNHTIRGVISVAAKKNNLRIERRREHGITSYRVSSELATIDDGQPTEAQEWHDYDRDC